MHAPETTSFETPADADVFSRDGFLGPIRLFTPAQCDFIARHLELGTHAAPLEWPKGRAPVDRFFYDLAMRPRLLALLRPLLGNDIVLWGVDVVERDPGQIHPWHTDIESSGEGRRFVSAWIGICNLSRESALQVITRSHKLGKPVQQVVHERGWRRGEASDEAVLAWARECDPLAVLVQPDMTDGEAILYDGRLWHATNNKRSEGHRIALLLQYAAADAPVSIPDFSGPTWPFRFKETRPPVVMVSGRGDGSVNRLAPPPPSCPESARAITTHVQRIEPPPAEELSKGLRSWRLFCGSTPILNYMECHYSVLQPGHRPHPPHQHPEESLGLILDGELESLSSDSMEFEAPHRELLASNSIIYQPAFHRHTHRNCSSASDLYLFFAWRAALLETIDPLAEHVVHFDAASASANPDPFERKLLFEHPTSYLTKLHAHLSTLQPGAGYDPHVDPYDVAIVLLAGTVDTLGRTVEARSFIYYAAGEPHGIRNVGDEPARYLVLEFHAPRRSFRNRVSFQVPSREQSRKQPAQEFRTFWVGPPLSAYEELSLRSLVARGQRVFLFSYEKALRVPDGVELIDADEILPGDRIHEFVHANGETSPTLHANLFRYEALRRFGGWYCDLDILLVGDHPPSNEVYIAREDETSVNSAVLRFPPGASLMVAAAEAARGLMNSTEWGASGPKLLTRLVDEAGLSEAVQPWTAAYPVRPVDVHQLFLPQYREELEDRVAGADFVHLWNQIWRRVRIPKELGPPEGSFLDSLFRSFGIRIPPGSRMSAKAVESWFSEFALIEEAKRGIGGGVYGAKPAPASQHSGAKPADGSPLADLVATLREVRWQRDQMLESTSWRVTAPVRTCVDALRLISRRRGHDA